ncbi:beta-lactamase [Leadbetterella byssophila DSM 17132]|uniref:Beta-lactamase n=1 Tax=Leadbetterella byssophila (strain DSM 17132 / JCM 16389 / KACC 11308 / NBRC 106382 / 4M15) TaxID=649349 RepID=E4RZ74_LEAB4|nr:serine hydrolase [Leadbetterella byssophila]ADQ19192.1 beta-lactamase [Leadbetterella byssophila DSM 17132]
MKRILLLLLFPLWLSAQNLPKDIGEGIDQNAVLEFLKEWQKDHEPHSIMIVRGGKVITEGWFNPFSREYPHTLYSVSKSFTATAVGLALEEGLLDWNKPIIEYFPDKIPLNPSENLKKLKIKDLLTMSSGHEKEPIQIVGEEDWVKAFLHTDFPNVPGKRFLYNSPATYMLSALVQKASGKTVLDYLRPRLFEPLGISGMDWEVDAQGINVGGWGLRLTTEDLAKFGLLFLNKGKWEGKQILPQKWVVEASSPQIYPTVGVTDDLMKNSDWHQGYGYQMWRGRHNTFRADGAYGQNIIVVPQFDAVIVTTGESPNLPGLLNLIWKYLLPALEKGKVVHENFPGELKALALLPLSSSIKGNLKDLKFSDPSLKGIRFEDRSGNLWVSFQTDSVEHKIPFGNGEWIKSNTTMKPPHIFPGIKTNKEVISKHAVAASYAWRSQNVLELQLKYTENIHTRYYTIDFTKSEVNYKSILGSPQVYR